MGPANPGLRHGLSSAVPAGLDIVTVLLTQTLKPNSFSILSSKADPPVQGQAGQGEGVPPAIGLHEEDPRPVGNR
jgi:hypothetical protein